MVKMTQAARWGGLTWALGLAIAAGAPWASAQATEEGVEEIIVTARKKEENLQTTPIAVTAVGAADLDARGVATLQSVGAIAPNVHFTANQPTSGLPGATSVFIRGIGQRDFTINIDPAVGVYFDGVYIGRSIGALLDLVEVDRIEVLRGPQNTLFGRNTIGGAINVVSKAPQNEFGGSVRIGAGDEGYFQASANMSIPLSERVRTSIGVYQRQQDGYVDALQYNGALKLGDDNVWGARGALAIDLTDRISVDLSLDYADTKTAPAPVVPIKINTLFPVGTVGTGPFNSFFNNSLALTGDAGCRTTSGQATNPKCYGPVWLPASRFATNAVFANERGVKVTPENTLETMGAALTVSAQTPFGQLKSITAQRSFDALTYNDVDFSPFVLFANNHPEYSQEQFSQEFQLVGTTANDRLDYVVGLYHFHETGLERIYNQIITAFNATTNPGALAQDISRTIDNTSQAIYAQATYKLTDDLSVTGGLRYTESEKIFTLKNILPTGAVDGPYRGVKSVSKTTPLITLGYEVTPDTYAYATYSKGFRDGGFAARFIGALPRDLPSYNPEFVDSFEIGLKNVLFDRRLRLNLAAFNTDYRDLQVDATVPPELQISQQSTILNLAQATIKGVEAEFDARPTEWLRIDGAIGYLDAQLDEVRGGRLLSGAFTITTRSKLPMVAEWTGNVGVTVSPRVGKIGRVFARVDFAYESDKMSGIENNPEILLDGRTITNASLRFVPEQGNWEAGLNVRNLTDEEYFYQKINIQALNSTFGSIARPRTVFATLKYHFGQ